MNLREITYDIIEILTKFNYTHDSRIEEEYINYKVNEARASAIAAQFERKGIIEPVWLQDSGPMELTEVTKAEDSTIPGCECLIYKIGIPATISLQDKRSVENNLGVRRVSSACTEVDLYPITPDKFNAIPGGHIRKNFPYYMQVGNALYINKKFSHVRILYILENPLDGYVLQTEKVSSLTIGEQYKVESGQCITDNKAYSKGEVFTATAETFTGTCVVKFNNQKRKMTDLDPYPVSNTMSKQIMLSILSNEFKIEASQLSDVVEDSKDQSQLTGNERR